MAARGLGKGLGKGIDALIPNVETKEIKIKKKMPVMKIKIKNLKEL